MRPRGGPGAPGFSLPLSPGVAQAVATPTPRAAAPGTGPPHPCRLAAPGVALGPRARAPATYSIMARAILLMVPFTEPGAPRDCLFSVLWAWALFSSRSWDSSMV